MARDQTRFSKISCGYIDSATSIAESDADFSAFNAAFEAVAATDSLTVGSGTALTGITVTSATVDFGSLGVSGGQSTTTVAVAGATTGDVLLVSLPSIWSVADYQVNVTASSGDTTGEVNLTALNSGLSAVDPTSGAFTILRIGN